MRNKKVVFVAFMIAMVALTQIQISPVLANDKEETPLYPVSGSDVDDQTFEIDGHLVADGFATAITMDLPVDKMESTHTRVAFAVGLGDVWEEVVQEFPIFIWEKYTPYVKKMWLKAEGDGDYEPTAGAIVDNTGTGGSSTPDFLTVLGLVFMLFDAYQIANFLMEVYQEPPRREWKQELHSVEAIVRQAEQPAPRLQTASAWFDSYFKRAGWNSLTITAEAEIWADHMKIVGIIPSFESIYVGTYQVSYEVRILVGSGVLVVLAKDQDGNRLKTGDVYVDGQWRGFTDSMFDVSEGTHTIRTNDFWEAGTTGYRYGFTNWEDGSTSPNRTVEVPEAVTAYFNKVYCPSDCNGDGVVNELDSDIVLAAWQRKRGDPNWDSRADLDCNDYINIDDLSGVALNRDYYDLTVLAEDQYGSLTTAEVYIDEEFVGNTGSTFTVMAGTRKVLVTDFWESDGFTYYFTNWKGGSTDNPRTMWLVEDTTIKAHYTVNLIISEWVSPTGFEDPSGEWSSEPNAYDDDTATQAMWMSPTEFFFQPRWSGYLILTLSSAIQCNRIRIWMPFSVIFPQNTKIDVRVDGVWQNVWSGHICQPPWFERGFSERSVDAVRIQIYNNGEWWLPALALYVNEFDFWGY